MRASWRLAAAVRRNQDGADLELLKGGALARIALPAVAHDWGEALGAVGGDDRPQALLHDAHRGLQRRHLLVRHAPRQQLPHRDRKGEHVRLLPVRVVLYHLRRHPPAPWHARYLSDRPGTGPPVMHARHSALHVHCWPSSVFINAWAAGRHTAPPWAPANLHKQNPLPLTSLLCLRLSLHHPKAGCHALKAATMSCYTDRQPHERSTYWSHAPVSAGLCCHDARGVHDARNAKVCNLDGPRLVHEQVGGFEIPVHNLTLVEVVHPSAHLCANLQHQRQLQLARLQHPHTIFRPCRLGWGMWPSASSTTEPVHISPCTNSHSLKGSRRAGWLGTQSAADLAHVVIDAPAGHELEHDAQVGLLGARANELHHILMPHFPHYRHLLQWTDKELSARLISLEVARHYMSSCPSVIPSNTPLQPEAKLLRSAYFACCAHRLKINA